MNIKSISKRISAVLLCFTFASSLLPVGALAAEDDALGQSIPSETTCTCIEPCTAQAMNQECPVCGAEGATPEDCVLYEEPDTEPVGTGEAQGTGDDTPTQDSEPEPLTPANGGISLLSTQEDVSYIDPTDDSDQNKICTSATVVTAGDTTWGDNDNSGWYVVNNTLTISGRVTVNGDVHLILADGCNLTVNGGIDVTGNNSLTIYAQSGGENMGALTANAENPSMINPSQAGIGGGDDQPGGTITINGGTVNATGVGYMSTAGAGIGGGGNGAGGKITINGGTVTAKGGDIGGAGIGGGSGDLSGGAGGEITINGGTVTATGNGNGAGIGGGSGYLSGGAGGEITITGGTVTATGGLNDGAGIGGGQSAAGGTITISGGTVIAQGGSNGAGIGGGNGADSGTFSTGTDGRAVIIASSIGDKDDTTEWSGVVFQGKTGAVYGADIAPAEDFTIPADSTLTIGSGQTLTISEGVTLTNDGTIIVENGCALVNQGTIVNNGEIQLKGGSTVQTGGGPEMTLPEGGTIDTDTGAVTPDAGGSVVIDTDNGKTTITPPNGQPITPNNDGSVTVPGGSTVTTGDGTSITIPSGGGTLLPDGSLKNYTVTVTFDSQGGSQVASQTVTVGAAVSRPADPTRSGYSFLGWYTTADGDTQWDFADPVTGNMTLYARWSQNSTGGGGSSSSPTYRPDIGDTANGSVSVTPRNPERGDTVTLTPDPEDGYEVDQVIVTDRSGDEVEVTERRDGTYTFTQPTGRVTIQVTFREIPEQPWENPFQDVDEGAWYAEAVQYVQENGLMAGTSATTFAPGEESTRAQLVTILWRLADSPVVNYAMDFDDVAQGSWYAEAVRWAASEGIAGGYGDGTFGPTDTITREQLALMLYQYAWNMGYDLSAGENTNILSYTDANQISEYAFEALQWACGEGLLSGTGDGALAPQGQATRAQIAVILMRFCERYQ